MRTIVRVAVWQPCFVSLFPVLLRRSPGPQSSHGTMVIVFKDGHRQSFNLGEIERVEFPAAPAAAVASASGNSLMPSRAHYIGKWEVGDGAGNNFY